MINELDDFRCDVCLDLFDKKFKVSGFGCCIGKFCHDCKKQVSEKCPYCRHDVVSESQSLLDGILKEKKDKYFDLVWYARRNRDEVSEYTNLETREAALKALDRIEEKYPKETDDVTDLETGDWHHGFNSGMLACLRYISTCINDEYETDEETGETYYYGGIERAEEEFPRLDS
jgi:hypothetical protein